MDQILYFMALQTMNWGYILPDTPDLFFSFVITCQRQQVYKLLISFCLIVVIIALFLSHSHYSIDILSGIFFAYAIRAYGESHFPMFDLGSLK